MLPGDQPLWRSAAPSARRVAAIPRVVAQPLRRSTRSGASAIPVLARSGSQCPLTLGCSGAMLMDGAPRRSAAPALGALQCWTLSCSIDPAFGQLLSGPSSLRHWASPALFLRVCFSCMHVFGSSRWVTLALGFSGAILPLVALALSPSLCLATPTLGSRNTRSLFGHYAVWRFTAFDFYGARSLGMLGVPLHFWC